MNAIESHNPEDRYVVYTGRIDIRPGDYFEHAGVRWQSLTYPNGAIISPAAGISYEHWESHDAEIFKPEIGELTAIKVFHE